MCNINLIFNKNGKTDKKINEVMNVISYLSFQANNDGEGYLSLNKGEYTTAKSVNKLIYKTPSNLLLTHQRYSTSGLNEENTQPICTKDLIVIHNGVIDDLGTKDESDTTQYSQLLQAEYKKVKGDLIKAIKNVNLEVTGRYSIFVYEKATGRIVYFKENASNMFILNGKNYLIMSTIKENVEYSKKYLNLKGNIKEVKPLQIYDVLDGFKFISEFKEKIKYTYTTFSDYEYKSWSKPRNATKKTDKHKISEMLKREFNATTFKFSSDSVRIHIPYEEFTGLTNWFIDYTIKGYKRSSYDVELNLKDVLDAVKYLKDIEQQETFKDYSSQEVYGY